MSDPDIYPVSPTRRYRVKKLTMRRDDRFVVVHERLEWAPHGNTCTPTEFIKIERAHDEAKRLADNERQGVQPDRIEQLLTGIETSISGYLGAEDDEVDLDALADALDQVKEIRKERLL